MDKKEEKRAVKLVKSMIDVLNHLIRDLEHRGLYLKLTLETDAESLQGDDKHLELRGCSNEPFKNGE